MTKEEVRTISLGKLQLEKAHRLLDVGAGTGSISIEASLLYKDLEVTAIEEKEKAVDLIQQNKDKFKTDNLRIIQGKAPIALEEEYDAIFIGGSGGNLEDILVWSFDHLIPGGRLVLNFILQENAFAAFEWFEQHEIPYEAVQVQIGKLTGLGKGHYYKPINPVTIIEAKKEVK